MCKRYPLKNQQTETLLLQHPESYTPFNWNKLRLLACNNLYYYFAFSCHSWECGAYILVFSKRTLQRCFSETGLDTLLILLPKLQVRFWADLCDKHNQHHHNMPGSCLSRVTILYWFHCQNIIILMLYMPPLRYKSLTEIHGCMDLIEFWCLHKLFCLWICTQRFLNCQEYVF